MSFTENMERHLTRDGINREIAACAAAFVQAECDRYKAEVAAVEDWLNDENVQRRVLLLSGPSSSGKTITANLLCQRLRDDGVDAFVVSLDDFYRGRGLAPRLPDGSFDYESPKALDLPQLAQCIRELLKNGCTHLPQYDFLAGEPKKEKRELVLSHRAVVVFEGIHALCPELLEQLPKKHVKKLLIYARTPICIGEKNLLTGRELRLIRRIVRDEKHRGSTAADTLSMWPQVVRGEEAYLFRHAHTVDKTIDTTHAFEPCMLKAQALPLLQEIEPHHPQYAVAQHLIEALEGFSSAAVSLLPSDCILWEFLE